MSNFQEELRTEGYENIVIIAVGQSVASNFNSNFCANSDLPLVIDVYPNYTIRDAFNGSHKSLVILDSEQIEIGRITLNSGLNLSAKNYITNIISENYEQTILGDINGDDVINIQDIILIVNMIISSNPSDLGDLNADGSVNVLDVILLVNIILER